MSANELVIWILLFLILLGLRQYYGKKEAVSVEYLKAELFEIIAKQKREFDLDNATAQTKLSEIVKIVDENQIKNKDDYEKQLKEDLINFKNENGLDNYTYLAIKDILIKISAKKSE